MHGSLYKELMNERLADLRADAVRAGRSRPRRPTAAVARALRAAAARLDGHEEPRVEPQCL